MMAPEEDEFCGCCGGVVEERVEDVGSGRTITEWICTECGEEW